MEIKRGLLHCFGRSFQEVLKSRRPFSPSPSLSLFFLLLEFAELRPVFFAEAETGVSRRSSDGVTCHLQAGKGQKLSSVPVACTCQGRNPDEGAEN